MDELAMFNQNLDNRTDITKEVKDSLKELVATFKKSFPNVSIANLTNKITTLVIKQGSKFEVREACKYNGKAIEINEKLFAASDAKQQIMSILIKIIAETQDGYGFANDKYLKVLNVGLVESMSKVLVNGKDIEDEMVTKEERAALISDLLFLGDSADKTIEAFFNHDVNYVTGVISKAKNPDNIYRALESMSYEVEPTCEVKTSNVIEAENAIVESFATSGNIVDYEYSVITSEEALGLPAPGVEKLKETIKNIKNQQLNNDMQVEGQVLVK